MFKFEISCKRVVIERFYPSLRNAFRKMNYKKRCIYLRKKKK